MSTPPTIVDRREARAWMVLNSIRQIDLVVALGFRYCVQVNETLQGKRNNRRVLQYLLDNGCPASHLNLPDDMGRAA